MKTKIYLFVALIFILLSIGAYMLENVNYNGIYVICGALTVFIVGYFSNILTRL